MGVAYDPISCTPCCWPAPTAAAIPVHAHGYANVTGRVEHALAHLRAVTGMTEAQAWSHVQQANDLWTVRSLRAWAPDLSILTNTGATLARRHGGRRRGGACEGR